MKGGGIDPTKIYLKVSAKPGETNKYDEFIWVENKWELLGQYEAAIDLTQYVGKGELKNEIAKISDVGEISKFVCIDKSGQVAGLMSKEQVADAILYKGDVIIGTPSSVNELNGINKTGIYNVIVEDGNSYGILAVFSTYPASSGGSVQIYANPHTKLSIRVRNSNDDINSWKDLTP